MYPVTDHELNSLRDAGTSATIDIALFTMCAGILVSLLVTISTVGIADTKTFASYIAGAIVFGVFTLWFGAKARAAWRSTKAKLNEIKGSV